MKINTSVDGALQNSHGSVKYECCDAWFLPHHVSAFWPSVFQNRFVDLVVKPTLAKINRSGRWTLNKNVKLISNIYISRTTATQGLLNNIFRFLSQISCHRW